MDQREMEDKASCLSSQIQAIQLQLQDVSFANLKLHELVILHAFTLQNMNTDDTLRG